MTIQYEIKSQLAKLLATEDIVVEHKKVQTAEFNVQTRVLTLPMWEKASNGVIDMLVGHEVGHALYTPDTEWWKEVKVPQQFVNVVEDARIEKLIKRRYEGLNKTFYNAYHELSDKDFFEIRNKDIDEMNLADRVNLYFKIGHFEDIHFSIEENLLVSKIELAETFEEVLKLSEELYKMCKQQLEQDRKESYEVENDMGLDMGGETMSGTPTGESGESKDEVDLDYENHEPFEPTIEEMEDMMNNNPIGGNSGGASYEKENEEPEVETMDALDEALKGLVNYGARENIYVELPKVDINKVIVSNDEVHKRYEEHWIYTNQRIQKQYIDNPSYFTSLCNPERIAKDYNPYSEMDADFFSFKKSAQKEVNYLVKEFECKKSAGNYARATTSRTGVLDTTKLINYRFSEDLFKKVTVVPDGKNHGLVFILDWSGSMNNVMMDTIKQLYNLIWFCRKVQIPYDVYAFTNDFARDNREESLYEKKNHLAEVPDTFSLLNFFNSKTRSKDLDTQMLNIWRSACVFNWNYHTPWVDVPIGMRLSGTPLNEVMICLHQLIPDFKTRTGAEKVQCVVLTDGESQAMTYHRLVKRDWEDCDYMGRNYFANGCVLRDRKLGKTYISKDESRFEITDMLIENLRDTFKDTNFIGIRIISSREGGSFIRRYYGYEGEAVEKMMNRWKKEKSFAIKTSGYHTYFGMASSALNNDGELVVKEDATKAEIKRAFAKSLKGKKMNKKILSEFIELVA